MCPSTVVVGYWIMDNIGFGMIDSELIAIAALLGLSGMQFHSEECAFSV